MYDQHNPAWVTRQSALVEREGVVVRVAVSGAKMRKCELLRVWAQSVYTDRPSTDATVQRPEAKGFVFYAGGLPVFKPIIEKAKERGLPVALPHFPVPEGTFADNAVQIAADTSKYPDPVAKAMCEELKKQGITTGSVAITQNNHNATEDKVAEVFAASMKTYCPDLKVLDVVLEGGEPTQAIAAAVSIIQANPDIVAGFSTTGGGPTTWAGAQKETGKKLVTVGMDYTTVTLDLVKNGEVWGIVAQPIYGEMAGAAKLVYQMANGEKVPYWTVLDAPLVTKDNLDEYYAIFNKLEPQFRAAVNPDALKVTPTAVPGVNGPLLCAEFGVAAGARVDAAVVPGRVREERAEVPVGDDG